MRFRPQPKLYTFEELIRQEHEQLEKAKVADANLPQTEAKSFAGKIQLDPHIGESWLAQTKTDRVGLALSGGGIRSATFGLGLLQSLQRLEILRHVDYLSTVSGGGYLGGFWTAWKQRSGEKGFPLESESAEKEEKAKTTETTERGQRERPEVRHMREFSRFLAPRIGVNEPEMWYAIAAVLGGMLPALAATLCLIFLVVYAWLAIGYVALESSGIRVGGFHVTSAMIVFGVVTLVLHAQREWKAECEARTERSGWAKAWRAGYWSFAILTTGLGMWGVKLCVEWLKPAWGWLVTPGHHPRFVSFGIEAAITWVGLAFAVALAWIVIEGLTRGIEVFLPEQTRTPDLLRGRRIRRSELRDKLSSRYLSWAVVTAAAVGIWELAFWLNDWLSEKGLGEKGSLEGLGATGGLTAVFAGLFVWLREWLTRSDKEQVGGGIWDKLRRLLKDSIPMIAASAGALSLIIFAMLLLLHYGLPNDDSPAELMRITVTRVVWAAVAVLAALKFFDPAYFGLHDFYRGRIARAYLGAAFQPDRQWKDDLDREAQQLSTLAAERVKAVEEDAKSRKLEGEDVADLMKELTEMRERLAQRKRTSIPSARDNRFTGERKSDDICLTDLRADIRPIHLVCCAANHLTGDALPNLYRGARSSVLSQRGISLGDDTFTPGEDDPPLMLSAAQTASAAAFNSQMGERSLRLGPAGSFLMTALNLRLGLWVQNPTRMRSDRDAYLEKVAQKGKFPSKQQRKGKIGEFAERTKKILRALVHCPGGAFFRELIGDSRCLPEDRAPQLHLSDGGHFENLGLYELVRRHCSYIIVSDAGEDESAAFDDLANAIRRVREDFGVEIEVDLRPVRPNENRISQQHLVVGTIHYDGFEGSDKGTLIYIKPTLTGDEPADIQQYRTSNQNFPHESTGDQFFSEAQWESYRRLGEHIGQVAFSFMASLGPEQKGQAETVFWRARAVWTVLPQGYQEKFHELNLEARALDADVHSSAPKSLRAELFPELGAPRAVSPPEDDVDTVFFLMRVLLLLENAWLALDLTRFAGHPMNDGWLNYFHRWAWTPSFRRWWVVLSPLFSIDFREFMKDRFSLRLRDPEARPSDLGKRGSILALTRHSEVDDIKDGHAWKRMEAERLEADGQTIALDASESFRNGACWFQYLLKISKADGATLDLQVGLLRIRKTGNGRKVATWSSEDFFVPAPLSGSGIKGRFLDRLKVEFRKEQFDELRVLVESYPGRDPVARTQRLLVIDFYKSRGFHLVPNPKDKTPELIYVFRSLDRAGEGE